MGPVDLTEGRIRVEVTVNDAGGQVVIDNFTKTRKTRAVSIDARTSALRRARQIRATVSLPTPWRSAMVRVDHAVETSSGAAPISATDH